MTTALFLIFFCFTYKAEAGELPPRLAACEPVKELSRKEARQCLRMVEGPLAQAKANMTAARKAAGPCWHAHVEPAMDVQLQLRTAANAWEPLARLENDLQERLDCPARRLYHRLWWSIMTEPVDST